MTLWKSNGRQKVAENGITIGVTAYERIFEASVDSYGLITVAKAKEMGIWKDVLYKLVARGRLERFTNWCVQCRTPVITHHMHNRLH